MKNLANCKPSEFLVQTNRIRKSVERWLTATDVANIRKRHPDLNDNMSKDERKAAIEEQVRKNLNAMLDAILEQHPQKTLELMALMCFVEPEHVDDYCMSEYMQSISELFSDRAVIGFFTSLVGLVQTSTSTV